MIWSISTRAGHVNSRLAGFLGWVLLTLMTTHSGLAQSSSDKPAKKAAHELKLDLDLLLATPDLWKMSPQKLESLCDSKGFDQNPYFRWASEESSGKRFAFFTQQPFTNVRVEGTLFQGQAKMHTMVMEFDKNLVTSVLVVLAANSDIKPLEEASKDGLENLSGGKAESRSRWYGSLAVKDLRTTTFSGEKASACLDVGEKLKLVRFLLAKPQTTATALLSEPVVELDRGSFERFCDLSAILSFPQLWETTPTSLEAAFGGEVNGEILEFQWLDADKSAARFTRSPYSNVSVDLTLFAGRLRVEEMVMQFKNGKVSSAAISIYNRGDSGEMPQEQFDALFKRSGQSLIDLLGVRPVEFRYKTPTAVKTTSWLWNTPHTLALLEYNADALTKKAAAEFLRLRLAPIEAKEELLNIAAIGQTTTTLGRAELLKFVKKEPNGDVLISGIPMVDQGAKGYCVVASCERLFGYLNIPCDQHELASIAKSEADRGTNAGAFVDALRKISTRFKIRFKTLLEKIPLQASEAREAKPERFAKMIQEEIDRGVPLLWALQLGLFPEVPNIALQSGGGHMRLIIGYNAIREEILFSDSWGAGHELKRMKLQDALAATYGIYLVEPKGR